MTIDFNLEQGRNRALVCYLNHIDGAAFYDAVEAVFAAQSIEIDAASASSVFHADTPQTSLNIALNYTDKSKRLKVGGSFTDVCVGTFFYNQPPQPELPEPSDDEPEPEPAPSITSLVCDALRETFGGTFGASAFVIPVTVTKFTLEVE